LTIAVAKPSAWSERLPAWSLFGGLLAAAGLPIYIYAPKYYADTFGVSLTALGTLLFALRLFDVVQDPFLGWLSERLAPRRVWAVAVAALIMALSMLGLFAVTPPINPMWWFGLTITGLFTSYTFLVICFYAQGIAKAGAGSGGHVRVATWRESGTLVGVCLAAVAPTLLMTVSDAPFVLYGLTFALLTGLAVAMMWPEWTAEGHTDPVPMTTVLKDPLARRLLILAFVNSAPLAVTSTLFLFFVESRLGAPGLEGPLLLAFFLSAAVAIPFWGALARRFGSKLVLLGAMVAATMSFVFAFTLGTGDILGFTIISIISGAASGADATLLPALFARRMATVSPNGGQGFGLWAMVNKATLAFVAVTVLPLLESAGFVAGQTDLPASALTMLSVLYALVPTGLKLLAIGLLIFTRLED
jgi:glycoside/pentoside/hexuronide:cation symporter, GPH family